MDPDYKVQEMDEKENVLSSLLDSMEDYGKTTFELFKLKRLDKASDIAGIVISRIAAIIAFITFLLMASIGAALWLGEVMGRIWYGFFAVAAFYGLVGVIVYFIIHKGLKRIVADMIINQSLK
jgi:ABC-type uncharacterized transport system fused permease/ATPase subunit